MRPVDVIPGSDDDRLLGIALNWVEIEPALPVAEELVRLKKLTQAQEDALADIKLQLEAVSVAQGEALQAHEVLHSAAPRELEDIRSSWSGQLVRRLSAVYHTLGRFAAKIL